MTISNSRTLDEDFKKYLNSNRNPEGIAGMLKTPMTTEKLTMPLPGLPPTKIDFPTTYPPVARVPSNKERAVEWARNHSYTITATAVGIIASIGAIYAVYGR